MAKKDTPTTMLREVLALFEGTTVEREFWVYCAGDGNGGPCEPECKGHALLRRAKHVAFNIHHSSALADWWTPDCILQAVIQVLGPLDLDPAAEESDRGPPGARGAGDPPLHREGRWAHELAGSGRCS